LLYKDILPQPPSARLRQRLGLLLTCTGVISGLLIGNLLSSGTLDVAFLTALDAGSASGAAKIALGLSPSILLMLIGVALM
jgi:hypothetical protein